MCRLSFLYQLAKLYVNNLFTYNSYVENVSKTVSKIIPLEESEPESRPDSPVFDFEFVENDDVN